MPGRRRRSNAETLHVRGTDPRTGRTTVLTAAAQIVSGPKIQRMIGPAKASKSISQPWQSDAWLLYDEIGELRAGMQWHAEAVSGVRLIAARVSDAGQDPEPVDEGTPAELVASWAGGRNNQSAILHRAALHLGLVGDTYIVGRTGAADGQTDPGLEGGRSAEQWDAYSTEETSYSKADGWAVNDGAGKLKINADDVFIRCWRPHPRLRSESDSAVRSARPILWELRGLTMHVMAQIDSRLAGAGLLLLPQSMTFPQQKAGPGDDNDGEDPFIRDLITSMITPIKDRDSAAAVVPVIAKVPDEVVGKVQHIRFWDGLDETAKTLRDEAIRRLALSLDMPPEQLLGLGDTNHWNGTQIGEEGIKLHVKPTAVIIAWALTIGWFRPALEEAGVPDPDSYLVWVDTSDLELRPDRSPDARELYDRFAVGPDTLRRESGFGEDDAPTDEELTRMVLLKLLDGAADPGALLRALGLNVAALPASTGEAQPPEPTEQT